MADVHKESLLQRCRALIILATNDQKFTLMPCGVLLVPIGGSKLLLSGKYR